MILVIYHFGFESGTLVLIAPVPGHCLYLTLNINVYVRLALHYALGIFWATIYLQILGTCKLHRLNGVYAIMW